MAIKINGKLVSGGGAGASNASEISYDNTSSGLDATTVKSAIDELSQEKLDKVSGSQGQVLGFDANGNIVPVDASSSDVDLSEYAKLASPHFSGNVYVEKYNNTIVSGGNPETNLIIGYGNNLYNQTDSVIVGWNNTPRSTISLVVGDNNSTGNTVSHCLGSGCVSNGNFSLATSYHTNAGYCEFACGKYNIETQNSSFYTHNCIIAGNGENDSSRSNAFRVHSSGLCYSSGFNGNGADYAEMFEWEDGNPNNEDRRGLFVTLKGDKIKLADSKTEFILGVVSAAPSMAGNVYDDQWKDMYVRDIFGSVVYEEVEVPEETIEVPDAKNPNKMVKKVISEAHTETKMKLNPDYDNTQKYTPRSERPEWDAVGMLGQLVMVDDGLCEIDGYCKPGDNGIAVWSKDKTKYRVMERLDNNHIKVLVM